jgi:protein-S-isoprenylcysteine O-methyltransferase Ste14
MLKRLLRQGESPPTWALLFAALIWAQGRYLPLVELGTVGAVLGGAVMVAGAALLTAAALQFRRHRTTILPREVPQAMISDGVYRISRNPIYVADALILAGLALIWDAAGLVLVPVFMWIIARRFILGEEAGMRARFGAGFEAYAARVRRWL